jgi:hypothetical protein
MLSLEYRDGGETQTVALRLRNEIRVIAPARCD